MSNRLVTEGLIALKESIEGSTGFRDTTKFHTAIGGHALRGRDARKNTLVKQFVTTPHYKPVPYEATPGDKNIMPQAGQEYENLTPGQGSGIIGRGFKALRGLFEESNLSKLQKAFPDVPWGKQPYTSHEGDLPDQQFLTYEPKTLQRNMEKRGLDLTPVEPGRTSPLDKGPMNYTSKDNPTVINPVYSFDHDRLHLLNQLKKYRQTDV